MFLFPQQIGCSSAWFKDGPGAPWGGICSCGVHGDDFAFAGPESGTRAVEERMHKSFLIKVVGKLGPDAGGDDVFRKLSPAATM